jgi:hypothetical protein
VFYFFFEGQSSTIRLEKERGMNKKCKREFNSSSNLRGAIQMHGIKEYFRIFGNT